MEWRGDFPMKRAQPSRHGRRISACLLLSRWTGPVVTDGSVKCGQLILPFRPSLFVVWSALWTSSSARSSWQDERAYRSSRRNTENEQRKRTDENTLKNAGVVVTGLGVFTPIGNGIDEFRRGLRDGRDGVGPIRGFDATRHRVRRAAEISWSPVGDTPYSRATEMALAVTRDAIASAHLENRRCDPNRIGVILASNQ